MTWIPALVRGTDLFQSYSCHVAMYLMYIPFFKTLKLGDFAGLGDTCLVLAAAPT
jgi:hypothetical protein